MLQLLHSMEMRLPAMGHEVTAIIHTNMGIVATYAFSFQGLREFRSQRVHGEWKYLDHAIFELPRRRAVRACIELAVMLRALDDTQNLSPTFSSWTFGTLHDKDDGSTLLKFRDVPNKIIHAESIDFDFTDPKDPMIVCHASSDQQKKFGWTKATIVIGMLAGACGGLASIT